MAQERIQKLLARAGVTSRRKAEELITSGRVRVDGRIVTELGTKANKDAKIEVDGAQVQAEQLCYGILHKPRQMMTTLSDPEGRPTIQDILRKVGLRVVPVGRLDFNTSGALLFTNDGDFAQTLGHPRSSAPKVYIAKVRGELDENGVARFRDSIDIEGKQTRPADVRLLRRENGNTWLEVTLSEGRNRQIRRLGEHANAPVVRLARLSHAGIDCDGLRLGEYRLLTPDELAELKLKYGVPKKIRGAITLAELEALPRKRRAARSVDVGSKSPRLRLRTRSNERVGDEENPFSGRKVGRSPARSFEGEGEERTGSRGTAGSRGAAGSRGTAVSGRGPAAGRNPRAPKASPGEFRAPGATGPRGKSAPRKSETSFDSDSRFGGDREGRSGASTGRGGRPVRGGAASSERRGPSERGSSERRAGAGGSKAGVGTRGPKAPTGARGPAGPKGNRGERASSPARGRESSPRRKTRS